jgi:pimeloyl-ACP methyl ester carboxylesterase
MFEYFSESYPWSLAVMMSIAEGGQMTEIDDACRPLLAHQGTGTGGDAEWTRSWAAVAGRVEALAREEAAAGRRRSAGRTLKRAANYWIKAERMVPHDLSGEFAMYRHAMDCFNEAVELSDEVVEHVTLDTDHGKVEALFVPARSDGPAPCVVTLNGFDAYKEFFYLTSTRSELLARGISLLLVDQPGVGQSLRFNGATHRPNVEVTVGKAIDWLEARDDVDGARIAVVGPSLGGFYGIRAAAREPRVAAAVIWGAVWDFGAAVRRRLADPAATTSVTDFEASAKWFFGVSTREELYAVTEAYATADIAPDVTCPLLIVHGEDDRQVAIADARRVYEAATGTSDVELRVFTRAETSAEHCGIDNPEMTIDYIADWLADRLRANA